MFTDKDIAEAYVSDVLRKRIDVGSSQDGLFDANGNSLMVHPNHNGEVGWASMNASVGPSVAKALQVYKY